MTELGKCNTLVNRIDSAFMFDQKALDKDIQERFKALRHRLEMSQTAFGRLLGRKLRQVQYYESGQSEIPQDIKLIVYLLEREEKFKELLEKSH
jgi:DNA-binding transcriptional regulator YiaG